MTTPIRGAGRFALRLMFPVMVSLQGCTDLEETPVSATTPDQFYRTEQEVLAGLASVYAQLRNTLPGYGETYWNLTEVSSDELVVPTRGQDWFDNGRWLELHRHTWAANSPAGLTDINGPWVTAFTGITRANVLLEALENVTVPNQAVMEAEARTLRAFFYYMLMDLFGGVPIVTTTELIPRERATRAEVFQFIEQELQEASADLPPTWSAANHGRMTKGAADAILASMYLNAAVFTKDDGISVTGYNSCRDVQVGGQTACDAAIAAANRILNSSAGYMLNLDWQANFRADNHLSPENILVVKFLNQPDLGFRLLMSTLHYNQFTPSPWNGFSTLADVYNTFDQDDQRRQSFLVGQQVNLDTGRPECVRPGCAQGSPPLVFTPEIADVTNANESEGARIGKWPHDPNHIGPENSNDFAYFRLAEIMLIKAEALNELSPGSAEALGLLNDVRARVFPSAAPEPLTAIDRDAILRERLFELVFEAKRRQDLIRHGKFTQAWAFKAASEPHRVLMPIPQTQLDANPLLTQNTGY